MLLYSAMPVLLQIYVTGEDINYCRDSPQCQPLRTDMTPRGQAGVISWRLLLTNCHRKVLLSCLVLLTANTGAGTVNLHSMVSNPLVSWRWSWKVLKGFASVHWRNILRCPTLAFQMPLRNLNDMKMICSWIWSTRPQTWFPYHNFLRYPELPTWYTKFHWRQIQPA